jgi:hypothetical protein
VAALARAGSAVRGARDRAALRLHAFVRRRIRRLTRRCEFGDARAGRLAGAGAWRREARTRHWSLAPVEGGVAIRIDEEPDDFEGLVTEELDGRGVGGSVRRLRARAAARSAADSASSRAQASSAWRALSPAERQAPLESGAPKPSTRRSPTESHGASPTRPGSVGPLVPVGPVAPSSPEHPSRPSGRLRP